MCKNDEKTRNYIFFFTARQNVPQRLKKLNINENELTVDFGEQKRNQIQQTFSCTITAIHSRKQRNISLKVKNSHVKIKTTLKSSNFFAARRNITALRKKVESCNEKTTKVSQLF